MRFIGFFAVLLMLFTGCIPEEDLVENSGSIEEPEALSTSPSQLVLKRDDESRIIISGGTPPYEARINNDELGTVYLEPGGNIVSVFSKPQFTGNFSVIISDATGNRTFTTVDITDGFQVFPTSRQVYPGRKVQITPLEGDTDSYVFTLLQGSDQANISQSGLLTINNDALDNSLVTVEILNKNTQEKEKSFIYIRHRLDSENITLGLGRDLMCIAKTNNSDTRSNLQCWGTKINGGLGWSSGNVESRKASEVDNTNIITSLAAQFPKQIVLSNQLGCATFYDGLLDPTKNARFIKCWGYNFGSPNRNSGLYVNTMGSNLVSYTFTAEDSTPLYIKKLVRGYDQMCALLTSNEDIVNGVGGNSASGDGEIRCWGWDRYGTGYRSRSDTSWGDGALGMNNGTQHSLAHVVDGSEARPFQYIYKNVRRQILDFPTYVHMLDKSFNPRQDASEPNDITSAAYRSATTKLTATDISSGYRSGCAIQRVSGDITCWGLNNFNQATDHSLARYGGAMFHGVGFTNEKAQNRLTPTNTTLTPRTVVGNIALIAKKIYSGRFTNCIIDDQDRLFCWGNNSARNADPSRLDAKIPLSTGLNEVEFHNTSGSKEHVISVAIGYYHTCALVAEKVGGILPTSGRIKCFGRNSLGQRGTGTFAGTDEAPVANAAYVDLGNQSLPGGGSQPWKAVKVVSGDNFSCAKLQTTGVGYNVKCWGENNTNQLGFGDFTDRNKASDAEGFAISDSSVLDISVSNTGSVCALKINGNLSCWGSNSGGITGQENFASGNENPEEPLEDLPYTNLQTFGHEIKKVHLSLYGGCALYKSGLSHCWGSNGDGSLGLGLADNTHLGDAPNELDGVATLQASGIDLKLKEVAKTFFGGCAIDQDDKVRCWGRSINGVTANEGNSRNDVLAPLINIPTLAVFDGKKAISLTAGTYHVCGLFENNNDKKQEVHCWGDNFYGELGKKTNTRYIGRYSDNNQNENPTSLAEHTSSPVNLNLGAGDTVLDIKAGNDHTCILAKKASSTTENYVKCWGRAGRIGVTTNPITTNLLPDGTTNSGRWLSETFVAGKINFGGENPVQLISGYNHNCVLFDTERVKCWGSSNYRGRLGWSAPSSPTNYQNVPHPEIGQGYVDLGKGRRATRIYANGSTYHTCAVLESDFDKDGRYDIKCWGQNQYGQLGIGSDVSSDATNFELLKRDSSLLKYK